MSINSYTVDQLVAITANFVTPATANPPSAPIDPTQVTMRITAPDGSITDMTSAVIKVAIGSYLVNFLVQQVGMHQYEWIGTGAVQAAAIGRFLCNQNVF
jgi:hypothetical protein